MQKPLVSSEISFFFYGSYIYVQLFHFNCIEKDLYIDIRVKLLNLKDDYFRWH